MDCRKAIVATLCYADVFDYPLTASELWQYLIADTKIAKKDFEKTLMLHNSLFISEDGWYTLSGRQENIKKRSERQKASREKMKKAKSVARLLQVIPTVQFIGVSGGLAMENADRDDDIDLFIIVSKNTIWITRLMLLVCLSITSNRRKRFDKTVANKFCLNMLLDEKSLAFAKNRQDLYSAHEIAQLKPLFDRNNSYQKFLSTNKWVEKFLPNAFALREARAENTRKTLLHCSITQLFQCLESFAKRMQLWYMKEQTNEIVSDQLLAFHPIDYKTKTLRAYEESIKKYTI